MQKLRINLFSRVRQHRLLVSSSAFFLIFTLLIFRGLYSRWSLQQGDAAGFVDAMTDQSDTGDINFTYGFSVDQLRKSINTNSSELNVDNFEFSRADKPFIHWHPYLLGFIVRLFPAVFQVQVIPLLLLASSYSLGLVLIFRHLYTSKVSSFKKVAIIVLFTFSPILMGSINGQPYFDKLFFGPCVATLFLLFRGQINQKYRVQKIVAWLIISFTFSERISLMASLIVLSSLVFFWKELEFNTKQALVIIGTCLIGIVWYLVWNKYISWNPDIQNASFKYYLPNLRELVFGFRNTNFEVFVLNVLPLLTLTLLKFRYFIITLFSITPNLLVNIGGAELAGYSTHYHSVYLPVLLFFGALSITKVVESEKVRKKQRIALTTALAFLVIGTLGITKNENDLGIATIIKTKASDAMDAIGLIPIDKINQRESMKAELESIFKVLNKKTNKTISAPESFMPTLTATGFGSINYFPIGVGSDDLIVVPYTDNTFAKIEVSIYGLLPAESRETWSKVIMEELMRSYKTIIKKSTSYGYVAIFEKLSKN